jgi:hypothetical protein
VEFESLHSDHARLAHLAERLSRKEQVLRSSRRLGSASQAQVVEHRSEKPRVAGSTPARRTLGEAERRVTSSKEKTPAVKGISPLSMPGEVTATGDALDVEFLVRIQAGQQCVRNAKWESSGTQNLGIVRSNRTARTKQRHPNG